MNKQIYPKDWNEIAKKVKDEVGWKCVRCSHPHDCSSHHVLTVHHLDGDTFNCAWWNLVALCQRCHLFVQNYFYFIPATPLFREPKTWVKPYIAGYYAHLAGLKEDKGYVLNNLDSIIPGV